MEGSPFLLSYFLILLSIAIARREGLGNEKELLFASFRTTVQLVLLGFFLKYLLKLESLLEILLVIFGMSVIASFIAYERLRYRNVLMSGLISINVATFTVIVPLLLVGLLGPRPHELIPFGGLIVGNSLNSITLSLDRFIGEVRGRLEEIEAKVALGASLRVAMDDAFVDSLRTSLIPKVNFMKAAGLVHIPGVAVGMLMAGADPMDAVLYQVVILYSLVLAGLLGSVLALYLSHRKVFRLIADSRSIH
ncbi:MAG TPA: ABC transporter permease [Aquifex aeolicus]|nr:ABC transporter permease [Aquifex aeolicus]